MLYLEAKTRQIEEFKKGNYFVLREEDGKPGSFLLIPAANRTIAQESIVKDAITAVKRFPTKLRVYNGGKN